MKKLSKLVALALACVMALTMLTACGGGGTVQVKYPEALAKVNEMREKNGKNKVVENAELDAIAESLIDDFAKYGEKQATKDDWLNALKTKAWPKTVTTSKGTKGELDNCYAYWFEGDMNFNDLKIGEKDITDIGFAFKKVGSRTYYVIPWVKG